MSTRRFSFIGACAALLFPSLALAASHALIMAIWDYEGPNKLPGVRYDVGLAKEIAQRMGIPPANIIERTNRNLDLEGMRGAMRDLARRVNSGDQVFVYYSGHGARVNNPRASTGCTEAMVSLRGDLLPDFEIAGWFEDIAKRSSRFIFMNDSCFSGGAITRTANHVAKVYKGKGSVECDEPVNVKSMFKQSSRPLGEEALYVAASADNEVAYAGPRGSIATVAWLACLKSGVEPGTFLRADQLKSCSQTIVDVIRQTPPQTITTLGNERLPILFSKP